MSSALHGRLATGHVGVETVFLGRSSSQLGDWKAFSSQAWGVCGVGTPRVTAAGGIG